jgi:two-component system sensor histidine kinase KdpD
MATERQPHAPAAPASRQAARRGHHKIFLGMAAGVGKTYRMLQEGQAEAEAGRDVVIGYLEPHNRPETAAQAARLEVVSRRRVRYRDTELAEMNLPALLARGPELALIDELAHTNAPGLEHGKRYQDVNDVLAAGIDVFSTVNVQHLESLNDQVADLTGARVRETVPDEILRDADEIVLVDLTPEALIARLHAGKIYAPERVPAALNGFFKVEHLAALREVALRQVAEDVESKRMVRDSLRTREDRLIATAGPQAVGERLLALITPQPAAQRVVRRSWRSAQRLGAELDILWVAEPGTEPTTEEREQLDALRRLASALGAHLLVEHGSLLDVVSRIVSERGTTYLLIGRPGRRRGLRRMFSEPLPMQLLNALPSIDLRVVTDRAKRPERS